MPINILAQTIDELPPVIPVFPLSGVLLLPRGDLPLNIFEQRYIAMVDAVLAGHRTIGMIQPALDSDRHDTNPSLCAVGCIGRLTAFQESGDGRYLLSLTGICRFDVAEELAALTPYRQCRVSYERFADDLQPRLGEESVNRKLLLSTFSHYLEANNLQADWEGIDQAPNEALVTALSMMAPYGPRGKQALLEAVTLANRAEMLVAMTEMSLARQAGEENQNLN